MKDVIQSDKLQVIRSEGAARFSLRMDPAERSAVEDALGCLLPQCIGQPAASGAIRLLCLSPDEWTLYCSPESAVDLRQRLAALEAPHALVDITARDVTLKVEGGKAAAALKTICPFDVDSLAPGEGKRTILDSAQAVITRRTDTGFNVEVFRSFAPHVESLLALHGSEAV